MLKRFAWIYTKKTISNETVDNPVEKYDLGSPLVISLTNSPIRIDYFDNDISEEFYSPESTENTVWNDAVHDAVDNHHVRSRLTISLANSPNKVDYSDGDFTEEFHNLASKEKNDALPIRKDIRDQKVDKLAKKKFLLPRVIAVDILKPNKAIKILPREDFRQSENILTTPKNTRIVEITDANNEEANRKVTLSFDSSEVDEKNKQSDSSQSTSVIKRPNLKSKLLNVTKQRKVLNSLAKTAIKKIKPEPKEMKLASLEKKICLKIDRGFAKAKSQQWRFLRTVLDNINKSKDHDNSISNEVVTSNSMDITRIIDEPTDENEKIEIEHEGEIFRVYKIPFLKATEETRLSLRVNRVIESLWSLQERLEFSLGKRSGHTYTALEDLGVNKVITVCTIVNKYVNIPRWDKTLRSEIKNMISNKLKNDRSNAKRKIEDTEPLNRQRRRRRRWIESSDSDT